MDRRETHEAGQTVMSFDEFLRKACGSGPLPLDLPLDWETFRRVIERDWPGYTVAPGEKLDGTMTSVLFTEPQEPLRLHRVFQKPSPIPGWEYLDRTWQRVPFEPRVLEEDGATKDSQCTTVHWCGGTHTCYSENLMADETYRPLAWPEGKGWEFAGTIGVDSGIVWVGDPAYRRAPRPLPESFWEGPGYGEEDLGIVVTSGVGDGRYEVYVRRVTLPDWGERIAELRVVFITSQEERDGIPAD